MGEDTYQTTGAQPRRRRYWIAAIAAVVVVGTAATAVTSMAGGFRRGAMDAETAREWAAFGTRQVLKKANPTPEQMTRIDAIVADAVRDLHPLRQQGQAAREQALRILAAPTVDRVAAEQLRAQQMAQYDTASRRAVGALAEVADVLTPDQRRVLAAELEERRRDRR